MPARSGKRPPTGSPITTSKADHFQRINRVTERRRAIAELAQLGEDVTLTLTI